MLCGNYMHVSLGILGVGDRQSYIHITARPFLNAYTLTPNKIFHIFKQNSWLTIVFMEAIHFTVTRLYVMWDESRSQCHYQVQSVVWRKTTLEIINHAMFLTLKIQTKWLKYHLFHKFKLHLKSRHLRTAEIWLQLRLITVNYCCQVSMGEAERDRLWICVLACTHWPVISFFFCVGVQACACVVYCTLRWPDTDYGWTSDALAMARDGLVWNK